MNKTVEYYVNKRDERCYFEKVRREAYSELRTMLFLRKIRIPEDKQLIKELCTVRLNMPKPSGKLIEHNRDLSLI